MIKRDSRVSEYRWGIIYMSNIETSNWLIEGMTPLQVEQEKFLACIGYEIRRQRVDQGITQKELANRLGVNSPSVISRWESGGCNLSIKRIVEIFNALGLKFNITIGDNSWELAITQN